MYQERDIVHEIGEYWVLRYPSGKFKGQYAVFKKGVTHSTRCAFIGWEGAEGLHRAIAEAERRAAQ